jgi:hypothetical protein
MLLERITLEHFVSQYPCESVKQGMRETSKRDMQETSKRQARDMGVKYLFPHPINNHQQPLNNRSFISA